MTLVKWKFKINDELLMSAQMIDVVYLRDHLSIFLIVNLVVTESKINKIDPVNSFKLETVNLINLVFGIGVNAVIDIF